MPPSIKEITCSSPSEDGTTLLCTFLATSFADQGVTTWTLLDFIGSMYDGSDRKVDVHHVVRQFRGHIATLLTRVGLQHDDVLHPPLRAVKYALRCDGALVPSPFTQDMWTADTIYIIAFLCHTSGSCRKYRRQTTAVFRAFISGVVDVAEMAVQLAEIMSAACPHCASRGDAEMCRHMDRVATLCSERHALPQFVLVDCLVCLAGQVYQCEASRVCFRDLLVCLRQHIHNRLDIVAGNANPLKVGRRSIAGRKRHHRECYKEELAVGMVVKQKALTGSAQARVDGTDNKSLREWVHGRLGAHLSACRRSLGSQHGTFVQCEDAARLGKPAKEIKAYSIFHPASNRGTWLANQAHGYAPLPLRMHNWIVPTHHFH